MDDARVIEKIEQLVRDGLTVSVEGQVFSASKLAPVIHDPRPDTLAVCNLSGFCGFINRDIDKMIAGNPHLIVVSSPESVEIVSAVEGILAKRTRLASARLAEGLAKFPFGRFMAQEEFAIMFQSLFAQKSGDDFEYVLSYASKLVGGTAINGDDDGITQEVTVRRGLSGTLKQKEKLKPIVRLSPYRTFREIEQPESEFLLRVRLSGDDVPTVALFEADGGAWINRAMANIVAYIESQVEGIPVIA